MGRWPGSQSSGGSPHLHPRSCDCTVPSEQGGALLKCLLPGVGESPGREQSGVMGTPTGKSSVGEGTSPRKSCWEPCCPAGCGQEPPGEGCSWPGLCSGGSGPCLRREPPSRPWSEAPEPVLALPGLDTRGRQSAARAGTSGGQGGCAGPGAAGASAARPPARAPPWPAEETVYFKRMFCVQL